MEITTELLARLQKEAEEKYPDTLPLERHVLRYVREAHIAGATSRQPEIEELDKVRGEAITALIKVEDH